jgi:hypothetical protein
MTLDNEDSRIEACQNEARGSDSRPTNKKTGAVELRSVAPLCALQKTTLVFPGFCRGF